jgi:hypothetical protein
VDNAPAHNSKMTQNFFEHNLLKKLLRPLYSPDFSLSDFYLFREIKSTLTGQEIFDEVGLLEIVPEILPSSGGERVGTSRESVQSRTRRHVGLTTLECQGTPSAFSRAFARAAPRAASEGAASSVCCSTGF